MGTHPIFESDFDCLTEAKENRQIERQVSGGIPLTKPMNFKR